VYKGPINPLRAGAGRPGRPPRPHDEHARRDREGDGGLQRGQVRAGAGL